VGAWERSGYDKPSNPGLHRYHRRQAAARGMKGSSSRRAYTRRCSRISYSRCCSWTPRPPSPRGAGRALEGLRFASKPDSWGADLPDLRPTGPGAADGSRSRSQPAGQRATSIAGSGVVHLDRRVIAFALASAGARRGKFNKDRHAESDPGHTHPDGDRGPFILLRMVGFFKPASRAGMDSRIAVIANNTLCRRRRRSRVGDDLTLVESTGSRILMLANGTLGAWSPFTATLRVVNALRGYVG